RLADPASGYKAAPTGVLLNGPIVPEGSRASLKADGRSGAATLRYAWYRGRRAPFLYFEGSIKAANGGAPIASMKREPGRPGPGQPALLQLFGDRGFRPRVAARPGDASYSPLWRVEGEGAEKLSGLTLNCPIVGS